MLHSPSAGPKRRFYVCLSGRERVLCGQTKEDGCVPLPRDAEQLISTKAPNDGAEWSVGWPAVVLFGEPGKRRSTVPHIREGEAEVVDLDRRILEPTRYLYLPVGHDCRHRQTRRRKLGAQRIGCWPSIRSRPPVAMLAMI